EIYTPVKGRIVAVNEDLDDSPELINSDPYGAWIYRIEPEGTPEGLLSAEQYREKISG
ncbi:MAG TPA: glycine cleavage system protein H, partial [Deltaproteobacteria bacterium]|nr:glycine cleavage system protein H [Deltaproteobacteria bacterium]